MTIETEAVHRNTATLFLRNKVLEDALTPMSFDLLLGEDIFLVHWISYFRTGLIRLLCGIIYCINNV
jgi:hypothetical protein